MDNMTFKKYQGLVKNAANYYVRRNCGDLTWDDLYQIGCLALIECESKFDSSFGVKFSTFAYKCISTGIYNGIKQELKKYNGHGKAILYLQAELLATLENNSVEYLISSYGHTFNVQDLSEDAQYFISLLLEHKIPKHGSSDKNNFSASYSLRGIRNFLRTLNWSRSKCERIFDEIRKSVYNYNRIASVGG